MGESKAQSSYHRHEMQLEYTIWCTEIIGRHHDEQLKLIGIYLFETFHDRHMFRQCLLQIVRTLIADFHQQGCGLTIDESIDTLIHIVVAGDVPVESFCESVECPESCIVALGGNYLTGTNHCCNITSQVVGTTNMSTQHTDDIQSHTINAYYCRVFVFILDVRCNRPHADTHRPNENEGILVLPFLAHL